MLMHVACVFWQLIYNQCTIDVKVHLHHQQGYFEMNDLGQWSKDVERLRLALVQHLRTDKFTGEDYRQPH